MRLRRIVIASALSLLAGPAAAQPTRTTVRVAMRDGIELATDVWTASPSDGPRPVLLRRTPYGRAVDEGTAAGILATGYVLVSQDVRGRGESDGVFSPFRDDAHDGFDTIAWIAEQPWSNGRVGTFGGSAEGIVQLVAAGEAPPALRCVHALVATGDLYEGIYPGGAWRTELGTAWLQGLMEPEALADVRAHEVLDEYWDPARLDETELARLDASVLLVGGFYDIFAIGTPRTFRAMQDVAPDGARERRFLVLGPWTHGGVGATAQGELTYPPDAAYTASVVDLVAYFDWCLKDGPRPSWPAVRYYVTEIADDGRNASGEWRSASTWPPPSAPVELRLHDDGTLSARAPAEDGAPSELPVDPNDPVPSIGGGNLTTPAGPFDQRAVDARDDVLLATTPVATEPVEIVGDVSARIFAASATTDVDVVVRLEQVTPSGRVLALADGIRRGRFAAGYDAIRPLVPGEPVWLDVDIGPVAFVLPPGHALRVAISGTSSPRYEPNPNVAEPIATATPRSTTLTIYRDAARPSAITLPIARGTPPGASEPGPDAGAGRDGGVDGGVE
ncbi:MAG TPA: CocE/NonD family hydrolase, partial [Sandaracinaceae bacterium]